MKKRIRKKKEAKPKLIKKIDYTKLKQSAYEFIVVQGHTQKDTAEKLGVSEVTLSNWARDGGWRDLRKSRQSTATTSTENLKKIISLLSERRLVIEEQITAAMIEGDNDTQLELRKQAGALSDEISKYNKTLLTIKKDTRLTLGIFIDVMDSIFETMRQENEALWEQTIDFQQYLIRRKSNELG